MDNLWCLISCGTEVIVWNCLLPFLEDIDVIRASQCSRNTYYNNNNGKKWLSQYSLKSSIAYVPGENLERVPIITCITINDTKPQPRLVIPFSTISTITIHNTYYEGDKEEYTRLVVGNAMITELYLYSTTLICYDLREMCHLKTLFIGDNVGDTFYFPMVPVDTVYVSHIFSGSRRQDICHFLSTCRQISISIQQRQYMVNYCQRGELPCPIFLPHASDCKFYVEGHYHVPCTNENMHHLLPILRMYQLHGSRHFYNFSLHCFNVYGVEKHASYRKINIKKTVSSWTNENLEIVLQVLQECTPFLGSMNKDFWHIVFIETFCHRKLYHFVSRFLTTIYPHIRCQSTMIVDTLLDLHLAASSSTSSHIDKARQYLQQIMRVLATANPRKQRQQNFVENLLRMTNINMDEYTQLACELMPKTLLRYTPDVIHSVHDLVKRFEETKSPLDAKLALQTIIALKHGHPTIGSVFYYFSLNVIIFVIQQDCSSLFWVDIVCRLSQSKQRNLLNELPSESLNLLLKYPIISHLFDD